LFARTGRPPRVADHSGGNLRRRLIATESNATYSIHDLGPHAWTVFGSVGEGSPIIVASPETAEATLTTLHHLATSTPNGKPGVIIINSTIPRRRSTPVVTKLARTWPTTVIIAIDWDAALAEPGPIDHTLVTTHTTRAITQVLEIVGV
jgi:hypothetical protein